MPNQVKMNCPIAPITAPPPSTNSGEVIGCGTIATFKGGIAFPKEIALQLGSDTGFVRITGDTKNIPDKVELWFEGVKVIDTGYRGSKGTSLDPNYYQNQLNQSLTAKGLPLETIVEPGKFEASFNKSTTHPYAVLKVFAPLGSTAWDVTVECPVNLGRPPVIL